MGTSGVEDADRWEWLRGLLVLRCGGRCEVTGERLQAGRWSAHHRLPRGMGGTVRVETLADLLAVTGSGTTGAHGWIETHRTEAYEHGWLIRRGEAEPVDVPVTLYSGRRVLLDSSAPFYLPVPPGEALYATDTPRLLVPALR